MKVTRAPLKMEYKLFLCTFLIAICNQCQVDADHCIKGYYNGECGPDVVICDGGIDNDMSFDYNCDEADFTLQIENYETELLTTSFFNNVHSYYRRYFHAIRGVNNSWHTLQSHLLTEFTELYDIDFSENRIKMISDYTFYPNLHLRKLNLSNNTIEIITPESLNVGYDTSTNTNSLVILDLSYNILKSLEIDNFQHLPNLLFLYLNNNKITTLRDSILNTSKLSFLCYLNISHNDISVVEEHAMDSLSSLEILDISNNNMSNMLFLRNCCFNITELYINNNKLQILPKNIFQNHIFIRTLDISMNKIIAIEQYTLSLNNLKHLNVRGNLLSGPIDGGFFSPAKHLEALDLSGMNITAVQPGAFADSPLVERLNLSHNNIKCIRSIITPRLIHLDVSFNSIEDIKDVPFDISPNLQLLYLTHNKLKAFNNQHTNKLTALTDLRFSSNQIDNLNLRFVRNLVMLNVSDNKLIYLNNSILRHVQQLVFLDVSHNNINDLPPGTFHNITGLKYLNVSGNSLTKLRFGSLYDLHNIEVLDISRNNIEKLEPKIFHECVKLKTLIIDYNQIKEIDFAKLISVLPELQTLSLGGNGILCSDILQGMNETKKRLVKIISKDKMIFESNVHGIQCETDDNEPLNDKIEEAEKANLNESTHTSSISGSTMNIKSECDYRSHDHSIIALTVWSTVMTMCIIAAIFLLAYFNYKNRQTNANDRVRRASTMEMREANNTRSIDLLG